MIGGSLLLAIRRRNPRVGLSAWARRPESVSDLRGRPDLVDLASTELAEVVQNADAVVLAMPTGHMASVVGAIARFESPGERPVLVTDVGSVKGPVVREIGPLVRARGGVFLGSHPMAGSEKKGLDHASADLFEGAAVVLTPEADSGEEVARLSGFWEGLGGVVSRLDPDLHDQLVAGISHLPHLVAAALTRSVLGATPEAAALAGGGFRDTTRVAGGPEEMWADILHDNREAVSRVLDAHLEELSGWRRALTELDRDRLRDLLYDARRLRGLLPSPRSGKGTDAPF